MLFVDVYAVRFFELQTIDLIGGIKKLDKTSRVRKAIKTRDCFYKICFVFYTIIVHIKPIMYESNSRNKASVLRRQTKFLTHQIYNRVARCFTKIKKKKICLQRQIPCYGDKQLCLR